MTAPTSLAQIEGRPYPEDLLVGRESALALFCAGFYGNADCVWIAAAGLEDVLAIDNDAEKLDAMRAIYPAGWQFKDADVMHLLDEHASPERRWDVVTADPAVSLTREIWWRIDRLCAMANRVVITGVMADLIVDQGIHVGRNGPPGWWVTRVMERNSAGAHWVALEPGGEPA